MIRFYVFNKKTKQTVAIYACDPAEHGVDNADAACGCEHAAADFLGQGTYAGNYSAGEIDFSGVTEIKVPPLSKAEQKAPTKAQADAYKAAVLADAEKVLAAATKAK